MWSKFDDGILDNPKVVQVGPMGFALYVAGIIYAERNLTDGLVPENVAQRLLPIEWVDYTPRRSEFPPPPWEDDENPPGRVWTIAMVSGVVGRDGDDVIQHCIDLLCFAGLWEATPAGFQIHDFLEYQPSKADVEAHREHVSKVRSEAGKRGADSRWGMAKMAKPMANDGPAPAPEPEPEPDTSRSSKTHARTAFARVHDEGEEQRLDEEDPE